MRNIMSFENLKLDAKTHMGCASSSTAGEPLGAARASVGKIEDTAAFGRCATAKETLRL